MRQPGRVLMNLVISRYRVHGLQILPVLQILHPSTIADYHDRVGRPRKIHAHAVVRPISSLSTGIKLPLPFPAKSGLPDRHKCLPHVRRAHVQLYIAAGEIVDTPPQVIELRVRSGRSILPLVGRRVVRRIVVIVHMLVLRSVVVVNRVYSGIGGGARARIDLDHVETVGSHRVSIRSRTPRLRSQISARRYLPACSGRSDGRRCGVCGHANSRIKRIRSFTWHVVYYPGTIPVLYHKGRRHSRTRRLRLRKVLELLHSQTRQATFLSLVDLFHITGRLTFLYIVNASPLRDKMRRWDLSADSKVDNAMRDSTRGNEPPIFLHCWRFAIGRTIPAGELANWILPQRRRLQGNR